VDDDVLCLFLETQDFCYVVEGVGCDDLHLSYRWPISCLKSAENCNLCVILLMVEKSGDDQLRLVVYSIIHSVLAPSQMVQDFFHQQYPSEYE